MHVYRCFFLNELDQIKAAEIIEADELGEAIDQALAMLRERAQHRGVEIWEGGRKLYPADELPRSNRRGELSRAEKLTIPFLRMAAVEARRIADDASHIIAQRLRVLAEKLDAEADDLSRLAQAVD
jgi:hypothetical protein